MIFSTESSKVLTIALSAYNKSQYFTLSEWFAARDTVKNSTDLTRKLKELNRKSATNYGVV